MRKAINQALKQERHVVTTIDDIILELKGSGDTNGKTWSKCRA
jgi:hypothetical protein